MNSYGSRDADTNQGWRYGRERRQQHGPDRGRIEIEQAECKGCGLCTEACPPRVIALGDSLNHYGYRTAIYAGTGCTGCGVCFLVCPEPGALTVLRLTVRAVVAIDGQGEGSCASN